MPNARKPIVSVETKGQSPARLSRDYVRHTENSRYQNGMIPGHSVEDHADLQL